MANFQKRQQNHRLRKDKNKPIKNYFISVTILFRIKVDELRQIQRFHTNRAKPKQEYHHQPENTPTSKKKI